MKQSIIVFLFAILVYNNAVSQAPATDPVTENMLLFQRSNGGWSKHFNEKAFDYTTTFSVEEKIEIADQKKNNDATIDNKATNKEIRYLAGAYKKTNNPAYLAAAESGIRYLLKAQYDNGGWPQYFPDKRYYRAEITFNDNAMINTMNVLQDVALGKNNMDVVNKDLIAPSVKAISKGIDCILKTQIKANGKLTAWCQQYDQNTLQPAKARAYELPSISGAESDDIVEFLMSQPNPSQEIKDAVNAAVQWFQDVKITGYKFESVAAPGTPKGTDRQLVPDSTSVIWARYYEIETNKPFFCDRDGVKKYSIQEIGYERRNGYAWFGEWPKKLLEKTYPAWVKKYGK
jgi:PelA/Pel-15E family pectate lyase